MDEVIELAKKFLEKSPMSELNKVHTYGMEEIGKELAELMNVDFFIVKLAIIFHDIAKDSHPINHAEVGAQICKNFLDQNSNFDENFIDRIVHCVKAHTWAWGEETHPETIEAQIVFDADMIQQLGDMGIVKHMCYKYANEKDIKKKVEATRRDLKRAASTCLTLLGREMAMERLSYVEEVLNNIMEGK